MNIATVTITRLGNKYLREFVEYYKFLGIDKMYIYDNNHEDEENIMDVVSDYVESGFVEVVDFRNEKGRVQELAYQDFYNKHVNDYDWYGLFDDDEYIVLLDGSANIKDFVNKDIFDGKNGIAFPMINFCDCGVIVNNKNTRLDVYTDVMDPNNIYHHSFYKTMVRGGLNIQYTDAFINGEKYTEVCHIPFIDGVIGKGIVDCDGNEVRHDKFAFITQVPNVNAYLRHIPTGSIDDYINMKRRRGWPDTDSDMNNKFDLNYFSLYNHLTQEKIDYYKTHTMKIALCVLTRLSNKYLREYIDHYLNLGIDKIYFYENNHEGEDVIYDVASDYVNDGKVEIIDYTKERVDIQKKAYQDFYDKHGKEYDWICIFDDDEYLVINNGQNIKEFLSNSMFDDKNGVCFPMINYCDSGVIVNDKNTRLDVYTKINKAGKYYCSFYKTIVRGLLDVSYLPTNEFRNTHHIPIINGKIGENVCDCEGNILNITNDCVNTRYSVENAFIKHIPTGSIDDYINKKHIVGYKSLFPGDDPGRNIEFNLDNFFDLNEKTQEKIDYYNNKVKNLA